MIEYRVLESIGACPRDEWDALFPGQLERFDYLAAVEAAGLKAFRWRYVVAEERGRLIAAMPAFLTDYALDTTLAGAGKRIVAGLRRCFPRALVLRMACLGSPCTETLQVGFAPELDPQRHPVLVGGLLRAFECEARGQRCGLLALKDVPADQQALWRRVAHPAGYRALPGMPGATLEVKFGSLEDYLASLSAGTRRDMRRKLRARPQVRIERRHSIDDVIGAVQELYAATRARAELQFEELTPAFFQGVLARCPGASCALYYAGGKLLAMNLLLEDTHTLLDKFFCMDAEAGREYSLYFLSWFCNVEYCVSKGLARYQSGQAGYANKLRLGSTLGRTSMYFRHGNALVNTLLRAAAPLFSRSLEPASES
ncbi:MAG TPA: GNAT family N-acetyltransferase [Steroidobacteraceae bacterium]|nr:GNAT family N-acetyltransferase [Steroidobacteraceae bacterium]